MTRNALTDLLLNFLNRHVAPPDVEFISTMRMGDWNTLIVMANSHKILPLLFHRLKRLGLKAAVPQEIWVELNKKYLANFARNLMLYGELSRIVTFLQAEQIPTIALKGLYQAQIVYRDMALRQMGDMDILVPAAMAPRVWELLVAHGYRNLSGHATDCDIQMKRRHHLEKLVGPGGAAVEIHWNLTLPNQNVSLGSETMQGVWDRAKPIHLGSVKLLALSPEDFLLHLCLHSSCHHLFEFGLQPSCDIAWAIDHFGTDLDWGHLGERAHDWGWERGVYLALRLAHDLMGARVPETAWDGLKEEGEAECMIAFAKEEVLVSSSAIQVTKDFAHFWEDLSFRGRVGRLLDRIFLPPEIMAIFYPGGTSLLMRCWHYAMRFRDLLGKYARVVYKLLRGDAAVAGRIKRKHQLARWLGGD